MVTASPERCGADPIDSCGLLILTALGEELTPLLTEFNARPVQPKPEDGGDRYFEARVPVGDGRFLRVVLASTFAKGVGRMTVLTSRALQRWRPRHTILAGVAAAVPDGKIALGSALVATTIIDAMEQKVKPGDSKSTRHRSYECDGDLLIPLRCFVGEYAHTRARFGLVICQPDVVKFAKYRDELVEPVRQFFDEEPIGLEMEGAALAIGVRSQPPAERPSFTLVKGAVDFASFRKNDRHREQAASTVARLLFDFVAEGWLATDPRASQVTIAEEPQSSSPPLAVTRLFGRQRWVSAILEELADTAGARIISIEGLGGIGKTALATRIADEAAHKGLFTGAAVYSLSLSEETSFRSQALVSGLAAQLGYHEVNQLDGAAAANALLQCLDTDLRLILVDNLERPEDVAELAAVLSNVRADSRTRWIITSRASARAQLPSARCLVLEELAREDAVALLEASLDQQRFGATQVPKEDLEAVYEVVGGNPQAVKLSAGLLTRYPTSIALQLLVRGKDEADEFYRHIYGTAWRLLSEGSRATLIAMRSLPQEGGDWDRVLALSGKTPDELMRILRELLDLNLVTATRRGSVILYALHRLTVTFVGEVMDSWNDTERGEALRVLRLRNIRHSLERMGGDGESG